MLFKQCNDDYGVINDNIDYAKVCLMCMLNELDYAEENDD